jgi:hypothetical protein
MPREAVHVESPLEKDSAKEPEAGAIERGGGGFEVPYPTDSPWLRSLRSISVLLLVASFFYVGAILTAHRGAGPPTPPGWAAVPLLGAVGFLLTARWRWVFCPDAFAIRRSFSALGVPLGWWTSREDFLKCVAVDGVPRGGNKGRKVNWYYYVVLVDRSGGVHYLDTGRYGLDESNDIARDLAARLGSKLVAGRNAHQLITRSFFGMGPACWPYQRDYAFHPINVLCTLALFGVLGYAAVQALFGPFRF